MPEVSYPFTETSESGGTSAVSEVEWQNMARQWGDCIDFQLTSDAYAAGALPFSATVTNGRTIQLQPGGAFVGGFYYQLTAPLGLTVEPNPTDLARKDTLVLRADLSQGAVIAAVVKGQPATSPVAPQPRRRPGDIWEMALYEIDVPARDGGVQISLRAPFRMPSPVATPWNTRLSSELLPTGTFAYDLDSNGGDSQYEAWTGRDGYVIARHFGKSRIYTPVLASAINVPSSGINYSGRWRWTAPNTVYFSAYIENTTTRNVTTSGGALGVSLPQQANGKTGQIFTGLLRNPEANGGVPNLVGLWGAVWKGPGASTVTLGMQSTSSLASGLDSFLVMPAKSNLTISGTYEANAFSE